MQPCRRYEMIDILRNNNFSTPNVKMQDVFVSGKRAKQMERRCKSQWSLLDATTEQSVVCHF